MLHFYKSKISTFKSSAILYFLLLLLAISLLVIVFISGVLIGSNNFQATTDSCSSGKFYCVSTKLSGGDGRQPESLVDSMEKREIYQDLLDFTGLSPEKLNKRLRRLGQHHFAIEHSFWNPETIDELRWYYASSQSYLFANSIHSPTPFVKKLGKEDGPVLDYSGGIGNNVLFLAKKGVKCVYMGIGMIEKMFVEYRVKKYGLEDLVVFLDPYVERDGRLILDPVESLPEDLDVNTVLVVDVFEHVPNYPVLGRKLAKMLNDGGVLYESTYFNNNAKETDIHLKETEPLEDVLGELIKMKFGDSDILVWKKTKKFQK